MIRDVNNVQGALNKAAGMGRGGDNQMVHAGTGEVMIPPEVIDGNPQVMAPLIKAFQKAGMDWRRYLVGSGKNSTNPATGAKEFVGSFSAGETTRDTASREAGGLGGGGIGTEGGGDNFGSFTSLDARAGMMGVGRRDPLAGSDPGFNPSTLKKSFVLGPLGPVAYGLRQAGRHVFSGPGYAPPGGMAAQVEGRSMARGGPQAETGTAAQAPQTTIDQPEVIAPSYLEFAPGMTPLQERTQIATYGLNSDDTRYQTPETQEYYKSLIRDELSQAGTLDVLTPIEQQYLQQVLGLQFSDFNSLMAALDGAPSGAGRGAPSGGRPGAPGTDTNYRSPGYIKGPVAPL